MTPHEIVVTAAHQYDQSQGRLAVRKDADAAWVAGQLAKRRHYVENTIIPALRGAGRAVDAERSRILHRRAGHQLVAWFGNGGLDPR